MALRKRKPGDKDEVDARNSMPVQGVCQAACAMLQAGLDGLIGRG